MDEWIENPSLHVIFKLLFERKQQIQKMLTQLEDELSTENRFFPQSAILRVIDDLVNAPHKKLSKGTVIYRARKIDKYNENLFLLNF